MAWWWWIKLGYSFLDIILNFMKNKLLLIILVFITPIYSDPLILQQADNLFKSDHGEIGIDLNYSNDEWIQTINNTDTDFGRRETIIALQTKYALKDNIELKVLIPYLSWKQTQTSAVDKTNEGIGVVAVGGKYNFFNDMKLKLKTAIAIDLDLPTGDATKELGKGLNTEIMGIGSMRIDPFDIHLNVGYEFTGAYINTSRLSVDMGDIFKYGIAIEYPLSSSFIIIGEAFGTSFSDYKVEGSAVSGTNGSTIDVLGGVRLNIDKMKVKAGITFSVGNISSRPYMWKFILGQSNLF